MNTPRSRSLIHVLDQGSGFFSAVILVMSLSVLVLSQAGFPCDRKWWQYVVPSLKPTHLNNKDKGNHLLSTKTPRCPTNCVFMMPPALVATGMTHAEWLVPSVNEGTHLGSLQCEGPGYREELNTCWRYNHSTHYPPRTQTITVLLNHLKGVLENHWDIKALLGYMESYSCFFLCISSFSAFSAECPYLSSWVYTQFICDTQSLTGVLPRIFIFESHC